MPHKGNRYTRMRHRIHASKEQILWLKRHQYQNLHDKNLLPLRWRNVTLPNLRVDMSASFAICSVAWASLIAHVPSWSWEFCGLPRETRLLPHSQEARLQNTKEGALLANTISARSVYARISARTWLCLKHRIPGRGLYHEFIWSIRS